MSEFIGVINEDGTVEYPEKTLSGRPITFGLGGSPDSGMVHHVAGTNKIVVFDVNPPKGFDWQATLNTLLAPPEAVIAPAETARGRLQKPVGGV